MPATLTITPWPDPLLDTLGHDPRSLYVETFWLPTLGPTSGSSELILGWAGGGEPSARRTTGTRLGR